MNLIKEYHDLEICNDCLYYNEFGNLGGLHEQCNLNAVSPCTTGNICEACVAVRTGFIELKEELGTYDITSNQDDPFFSLLRCEICARKKGGDRHEVIAVITSIRNKQIGRKK